jgi:hypothetical protein
VLLQTAAKAAGRDAWRMAMVVDENGMVKV